MDQDLAALPPHLQRHVRKAPTGCWLWEGGTTGDGYGRAYLPKPDGTKGTQQRAHRAVWEALRGSAAEGLVFDHLCRVTLCVRPSHLELVTQQINLERSAANGGALYVPPARPLACRYGHAYTPENTRVTKRGHCAGVRECRQCARLRRWWTAAKRWEAQHYAHA